MLEIVDFRARTLNLSSIQVSWAIAPTPEDVLDYRFQVLRAEGPEGPWQEMTGPFVDRYLFLDNFPEPFNFGRPLHYRLRVQHAVTLAVKEFGPALVDEEPDLIALEVRRHWDVTLYELNGRRCWLFPARTFGTTCKACYDKITQRVTASRCEQCYGTGYARGFHHPVEMWMKVDPTPKLNNATGAVVSQLGATRAYLGAFPRVKQKDLIVEPNNRRWRVASVESTERLRAILHQAITLVECAPGDIEMDVPVVVSDLETLALAAERNYKYRLTV